MKKIKEKHENHPLFDLLKYVVFIFTSVCKVCGISADRSEIKPASLALEGKILTTGLSGKPQSIVCKAVWY